MEATNNIYSFKAKKTVDADFTIDFDAIFNTQTEWMRDSAIDSEELESLEDPEARTDDFGLLFYEYLDEIGIDWDNIHFDSSTEEDARIGDIENAYEEYVTKRLEKGANNEISW